VAVKRCRYCNELFESNPRGRPRAYCYKPECIEAEGRRAAAEARKLTARWKKYKREKSANERICSCCHINPVMPGNHFLCEDCFRDASQIIEIDEGYKIDRFYKNSYA